MTARPDAASGGPDDVRALAGLVKRLDEDVRRQALSHSSWVRRRVDSWGRLAFLGDSVLGLTIAAELYERFPRSDIGRLTKIHGQAVSGRACAEIALLLDVPGQVEALDGAAPEGGIGVSEMLESERALASITEALIGACYLQHGAEPTAAAVRAAFEPQVHLASETMLDFKSALQERLAQRGAIVSYAVVNESGPPHRRVFEVEARVGSEVVGAGAGSTKKAAEQAAAELALATESAG